MASSLDGKIAAHALESDKARRQYGFTNLDDQEHVRQQLETADAVITGANSLRASGAAWQVLNHKKKFADWIVFTKAGLDPGLRFWNQPNVSRIVVSPQRLSSNTEHHGVENWVYGEDAPGKYVVDRLRLLNYDRVLLFGGGAINKIFYQERLVNELIVTICPIILGSLDAAHLVDPGLDHPVHLSLLSSQAKGNLVFLNYAVTY